MRAFRLRCRDSHNHERVSPHPLAHVQRKHTVGHGVWILLYARHPAILLFFDFAPVGTWNKGTAEEQRRSSLHKMPFAVAVAAFLRGGNCSAGLKFGKACRISPGRGVRGAVVA